MNRQKVKDAMKSLSELGQSTAVEVAATYGADYLKEGANDLIKDVALDTSASFLPGVLGARMNFKQRQFERNISLAMEEMVNRVNEIERNLQDKTEEQRVKLNELFSHILDYIVVEPQTEKIEYFINGYVKITAHETITDDFVLTYYDLMSSLRMVDLAVLRLYCKPYDDRTETYTDIMEKYGLTQEQYISVQNNLFRLGLLTTKKDTEAIDDLDSLAESVKIINKYLTMVSKGKHKNLPKLKDPKLRSKERFQLARFGRQFYEFFMETV